MTIGIDGNMWYCSNGLCLGDARSKFTFARTLREAAEEYKKDFGVAPSIPPGAEKYFDMTPEQFNAAQQSDAEKLL